MYEKFNQYLEGLISLAELNEWLDNHSIQGSTENRDGKIRFVGFDYKNQNWIRIN